jgi:hypothetical protein
MSKAPPWYVYPISLALLPVAFWVVGETIECLGLWIEMSP